MLEADEGPLDVEDVVADHVGFTVFDQELEGVHGFLDAVRVQNVTDQTQIDISCKERKFNFSFIALLYKAMDTFLRLLLL